MIGSRLSRMLGCIMKIACVLITHLPIKAELRRRPDLLGRPAIITQGAGSRPGSSQVVLDRSPEARGVVGGMPLQEAMSRCKGATLLEADGPYYQGTFDTVVDLLAQRSPLVERGELGCAYVGLDGLEEMYGGEARLVASLLQAAPQYLNPRVGLAQGKFPAYVAAVVSNGGQATRIPDGDVARFLGPFTLDLLPLPWESKARLHRFGLHTMGDLASLELGALQAQLGLEGGRAWALARGVDTSPLVPFRHQEEVREYLAFPSPTATLDAILVALEIPLGRAFASPLLRGRYVRAGTIESRVFRKPPWTRRFAFKEAVGSRDRALFAMKGALRSVALPGALEDMELTLSGFAGETAAQGRLFADVRRQEQLRETMRQLEARLGRKPPIYQVRDVESGSRIAERRQALVQFDP